MTKIERLNSMKRLLAALAHVSRLKANGSTGFGKVIDAEQHAHDLGLTVRLRILYFAFAALRESEGQ
jgi:hypothetical protein